MNVNRCTLHLLTPVTNHRHDEDRGLVGTCAVLAGRSSANVTLNRSRSADEQFCVEPQVNKSAVGRRWRLVFLGPSRRAHASFCAEAAVYCSASGMTADVVADEMISQGLYCAKIWQGEA